jgi:hypothetical protein
MLLDRSLHLIHALLGQLLLRLRLRLNRLLIVVVGGVLLLRR